MRVTVYTKTECPQCVELLQTLERLRPEYGLEISLVNTEEVPQLPFEQLEASVLPALEIEGGRLGTLQGTVTEDLLREHLETARRGYSYSYSYPPSPAPVTQAAAAGSVLPAQLEDERVMDRVAGYVSRRWLRFVTGVLGTFLGVAWLAPLFAALGWWSLADPIYTAYAFV